jgi:hypothetical protein
MFQTSLPSFRRTLPVIPGIQTMTSRVIFLGTRPSLTSGQPMVKGSRASCQDAPGYRVTAGACGTADLDKLPLTCL